MRRELGQLSLADGLVEGAERNRQLAKIAALVDWTAFERLLGQVYAARVGRPSYGPVVLLRCLLLQQWYRLSDPGARGSTRGPAELSPLRRPGAGRSDHSAFSRFRSEPPLRRLIWKLAFAPNIEYIPARGYRWMAVS
jgi:IS5 family transposase